MSENRTALTVLVVATALIALLWVTAISPKRAEHAAVRDDLAGQQQRLEVARVQVVQERAARERFPALRAELRRLDVAVPAGGEISTLLRSLQRGADRRGVTLRIALLQDAAAASVPAPSPTPVSAPGGNGSPASKPPGATPPTAAPPAGTGGTATPATDSASLAALSTPGAVAGPAGVAALPFRFTFTGRYTQLLDVLAAVRRAVSPRGERVAVRGRLMTIDGLSLTRPDRGSPVTRATVNATAYVAAPVTAGGS